MKKNLTLVLALLGGGLLTDPARAAEAPHETPVPVAAADYVSAETIDGAGLVLDPLAEPDGASLRFSGTGPRGRFALSGRENLAAYAAMLRAIAELGKMDREKMFGRAAGKAAKAPVEAAAKLVTDPAKTLSALPKGAMNFLKRTGRQIKENSRQIAEGSANSTAAADLIGLGSIKRQLAVSLGVDPYLPDETFQNILNETASAAYFGGIGVKALTMLVAPAAI
jgi:predicted lipoprotein